VLGSISDNAGSATSEARYCGKALGLAVRCNLMAGADTVMTLRNRSLDRLGQRHASDAALEALVDAFDLATLEQMAMVKACNVPEDRRAQALVQFHQAMQLCTGNRELERED
jgi:hypothetical protein